MEIRFLSSWVEGLTVVNVCPWRLFACGMAVNMRSQAFLKAALGDTGEIMYFVLEGISHGLSVPQLNL